MLLSGEAWQYWELLLFTEMCSGLSWSARDLMLLALLAVLTLLMPEMLVEGGRGCGELGELRELWTPGEIFFLGERQRVQVTARGKL